jgi:Terminase large subunit, T4likevirus-type, N-terminal
MSDTNTRDDTQQPTPCASPSAAFLSGLTLHPAQARFVACAERFSFYVGGVGAGKTYAGAVRAIARAHDHPGSLGLIGAPTYPMLRDVTARTFFELLDGWLGEEGVQPVGVQPYAPTDRPAPSPSVSSVSSVSSVVKARPSLPYTYHKTEGHLRLPYGSEILFRSLDEPDRIRGLNLAWFWLDEAAKCGHHAWQLLKGRLRQRGYVTAGWATGTPRGRDGFARDFELAPRPHHLLVRASTLDNLHNLPEGYVEDLGYEGAFYDQEVLGRFTDFEGLVYFFDASDGGHLRAPEPGATFARVIGGVDWGYVNPTAACVFGLDGDRRAWQLAEFYQRRAGLSDVVLPALVELTRTHGVQEWWCGPDEPEHIDALTAALRREGLACRATAADDAVVAGIQTVSGLLAWRADGTRGLCVSPGCVATIAEYGTYQYEPVPESERRNPAEHPLKQGDHALDATRYALHSELSRWGHTEAYLDWLRRWVELQSAPTGESFL